jgi:short-subunit dehydrogenase
MVILRGGNMSRVIVITGASAGIGLEIAKYMKSKNYIVYNLSRRNTMITDVITIPTDVTNTVSVKNAIDMIENDHGRIDVLINNAGMGISGAIEDTEITDAKYIFDVNFFGVFLVCKEVIPLMRKNGGGTIVNMSSVAAAISIPFQSFYSATKSAVTSFSDSLRSEVGPFGIKVITVLPGDVKTEFTANRKKNSNNSKVYQNRIEQSVAVMERDEQNGIPADIAVVIVAKAALKKNPRLQVVIGGKYKVFMMLLKIVPHRLVRYIVNKMYG